MSAFALKCVAVISMLIDHLAVVLYGRDFPSWNMYLYMRAVGRLAFPLYCFLLVNGFEKTSNRKKYLSRLIMFGVISQIPFSMVFSDMNYGEITALSSFSLNYGALQYLAFALAVMLAYMLFWAKDSSVIWLGAALLLAQLRVQLKGYEFLGWELSVFYTLSLGFASISVIEGYICKRTGLAGTLLRGLVVLWLIIKFQGRIDYGYLGVLLIIALYLCRETKTAQMAAAALWCCAYYRFGAVQLYCFSFAAAALILFYNGRRGGPEKFGKLVKWGFYAFYPAHLLALGLANMLF